MYAWDELKRTIKVYSAITGGPSQPLCERLLKLPDFIDDIQNGKDPSEEMAHLAHLLAHEVTEGVYLRLCQMVNQHPGAKDTATRLQHMLQWAKPPLEDQSTTVVYRTHVIRMMLDDAELGLRCLQGLTGQPYPTTMI